MHVDDIWSSDRRLAVSQCRRPRLKQITWKPLLAHPLFSAWFQLPLPPCFCRGIRVHLVPRMRNAYCCCIPAALLLGETTKKMHRNKQTDLGRLFRYGKGPKLPWEEYEDTVSEETANTVPDTEAEDLRKLENRGNEILDLFLAVKVNSVDTCN